MRKWLEAARRARYVGVAELAQEAARVLAESGAAQQARGTVTELPDERTVRYYLAEGLLPPAEEKQGTASVFGYRHLLRLLAVKKMQAEHLPIRAIRELVSNKTDRQLEKLLGAEPEGGAAAGPAARGEALGYLESLLKRGAPASASSPPAPSAPPPAAAAPEPPPARSAPPPAAAAPEPPPGYTARPSVSPRETWARVEIEPGLEVHVSDSYRAPQGEGALRRLTRAFLDALRARGGGPPGRGGR